MAAFFLDENIALAAEAELRSRGHTVTSTFAEHRTGAPDALLLLDAAQQQWTLVTHNRGDFRRLHDAWLRWSHAWGLRQPHAGILVLDRVKGQTALETAHLIDALVRDPTTNLRSSLYVWTRRCGWARFPG